MTEHYLPEGLPAPVSESDGLSAPYWDGLRRGELMVQRCADCETWQYGPEWICHACHGFRLPFTRVMPRGTIFSWERVWHASHPALKGSLPYLVVLVDLPDAGHIRLIGNLLGDPMQSVEIGTPVEGVFEAHAESDPAYGLLQWQVAP